MFSVEVQDEKFTKEVLPILVTCPVLDSCTMMSVGSMLVSLQHWMTYALTSSLVGACQCEW